MILNDRNDFPKIHKQNADKIQLQMTFEYTKIEIEKKDINVVKMQSEIIILRTEIIIIANR